MLKVTGLTKKFENFTLEDVGFTLPAGYIMGFIGMNGAGKTTTIKSIMRMIRPDAGRVEIFGLDMAEHELEIKQSIGFAAGAFEYYRQKPLKKITDVYRRFFRDWDETAYRNCLKRFSLDETQRVSQLSAGMRVKYGLALGLSHNARLFIFDEPTSGLDPVARDDLLDLFLSLIEDGSRSILFSTHITSDLDKCADYVTFIKNGRIVMSDAKDEIIDAHTVVSGGSEMLASLQDKLIGVKSHDFGFKALMKTADVPESLRATAVRPDLEDITVYYNR